MYYSVEDQQKYFKITAIVAALIVLGAILSAAVLSANRGDTADQSAYPSSDSNDDFGGIDADFDSADADFGDQSAYQSSDKSADLQWSSNGSSNSSRSSSSISGASSSGASTPSPSSSTSGSSSSSRCYHYESGRCWDDLELEMYSEGLYDRQYGYYGRSFDYPDDCNALCRDLLEDAYEEGWYDEY